MSLPRYAEYKDSGVAWLGEVPAHWDIRRTKFLFDLMKRPVEDGEGIVTAFRDGQVTLRSNRRIDGFTNALQEIGYQGVRKGDLVIHAMDAFAGAIGASDSDGKSTPVYSVCKPKVGVSDSTYFAHLLRYMALGGFVTSLAKGIRERSTDFRWTDAGNLFLPVPKIDEQTSIVTFLDRETGKIDALIAEQEKLLTLLAEKRQATISHAVTRGLNPNAPMKDSGVPWLGKVPSHWSIVRIKHAVRSIEQGWSPQCESYPAETPDEWGVLKVGCVNGGVFTSSENKRLPDELEPISQYALKQGDLLVSRANTRELVGGAAVVTEDHPKLLLCDKLYRLRMDAARCIPEFLAAFLGIGGARSQIELQASGASSSMLNIGQSVILDMSVAFPPIEEQLQIVDFIKSERQKLEELQHESMCAITLLKERRSALIAAAVTGKIDVRQAA